MTLTTYPVSAADSPDLTALSLSRLVHRLELNLLVPSADLSPLRQSEYQRMRVGANIAFAQSTLTSLERTLPTIKAPDRRNDLQTDLTLYRQTLKKLQAVLDEITTEAEVLRSARRGAANQDVDDESESESLDGEDLLGVVTPDEGSSTSGEGRGGGLEEITTATTTTTTSDIPATTPQVQPQPQSQPQQTTTTQPTKPEAETTEPALPTLRNRSHLSPSATAPPTPATSTTTATGTRGTGTRGTGTRGTGTGTDLFPLPLPHAQTDPTPSSSASAKATESQLTTDRTTQEDLTTSLLSLASQLKSSSQAFHASLESEKSVLARAVDGLDRTTGSMGAAERRMGTLRRMTEGKGWWGRMMLYAWIFGLWLVAILIVFLGPKLRF